VSQDQGFSSEKEGGVLKKGGKEPHMDIHRQRKGLGRTAPHVRGLTKGKKSLVCAGTKEQGKTTRNLRRTALRTVLQTKAERNNIRILVKIEGKEATREGIKSRKRR